MDQQSAPSFSKEFPPGTVCIESTKDEHVSRSPEPSSDPNDPLNWTTRRKATQITILALYTLMVFASNTVSVPLYQDMSRDLNYGELILDASYASNSAALGIGSILFVPFALIFGRRIVYIITSLILFGCNIWQARTEGPVAIIVYSILQGFSGSVNEALWQMTVTDLFFVHQRGTINGLYLIMVMTGNFVAPVPSGSIAQKYGWRWSFWATSIISGIVTLAIIFLLEESKYNRVPKVDKVARESTAGLISDGKEKPVTDFMAVDSTKTEASSNTEITAQVDHSIPVKTYIQRLALLSAPSKFEPVFFLRLFYRPFVVLYKFPAILCGAMVYGFYIAAMNVLAITQTTLYSIPPYNFGTIGVANMNVPPAIGSVIGSALGGPLTDKMILYFAKRNKGIYEPEMRMWLIWIPAAGMIAGIFLYGLAISQGMPWIISAVGAGMMCFGLGGAGDMLITYLQDSYTKIIGTAFVGAVFIANILSTIFLFAITPWTDSLGTYYFFVSLGCIAVGISLVLAPLVIWGKRWRYMCAERYFKMGAQLGK